MQSSPRRRQGATRIAGHFGFKSRKPQGTTALQDAGAFFCAPLGPRGFGVRPSPAAFPRTSQIAHHNQSHPRARSTFSVVSYRLRVTFASRRFGNCCLRRGCQMRMSLRFFKNKWMPKSAWSRHSRPNTIRLWRSCASSSNGRPSWERYRPNWRRTHIISNQIELVPRRQFSHSLKAIDSSASAWAAAFSAISGVHFTASCSI